MSDHKKLYSAPVLQRHGAVGSFTLQNTVKRLGPDDGFSLDIPGNTIGT